MAAPTTNRLKQIGNIQMSNGNFHGDGLLDRYPIDFGLLKKGDEFNRQQLEDILGEKAGTEKFQFARLALQGMIHERTDFTAKCMGDDGLRILTDPEASEHNAKRFDQGLRAMAFRHQRNALVDVEQLSEDQRRKHDRQLMIQSRYVSAMVKVSRMLAKADRKRIASAPPSDRPDPYKAD